MRYRWKLLLLLLVISLVPMIVMRAIGTLSLRRLGSELISQGRESLLLQAENRIRLLLDAYSASLSAVSDGLESVLTVQAVEVERCLAAPVPARTKVFFAEDFRQGRNPPPDLALSAAYFRLLPGDTTEPLPVSFLNQVFEVAPGAKKEAVSADITRLTTMAPFYRRISPGLQGLVLWYYTALANGVSSAYPGHGCIPQRLDLRREPWYETALAGRRWSDRYVEPETRQIVMAASMPVRRPSGALAGVTALVVPVSRLLEHSSLIENILPGTKCFLARLENTPDGKQLGIRAVALGERDDSRYRSWQMHMEGEWFLSPADDAFQAMATDFQEGKTNFLRLPYAGRDSLWAYGPLRDVKGFLVLITPYDEILAPIAQAEASIQGLIHDLFTATSYSLVAIVVVVVILSLAFARTVTKPLEVLAAGAKRLAAGDFDANVAVSSSGEFGDVARTFNMVGPQLKEHYKVRQALALAMEVQQHLIPAGDPVMEGLDIAGAVIYCDETGGDYYDYLLGEPAESGPDKIAVVVGDVSDHGIPSALLMTTARALLRQRAAMAGSMSEIVSDVNRQLTRDVGDTGRFITLFSCEMTRPVREIRWVRAGHDPAILYDPSRDHFDELAGVGIPLGVSETYRYEEARRDLSRDQIILIGSDGIWETQDPEGETFGKERVRTIMKEHALRPAREILAALLAKLESFRGSLKPQDDVTCVIIKITG